MLAMAWLRILGVACLIAALFATAARSEMYCDDLTKRYHTDVCQEKDKIRPRYLKKFKDEAEAESRGYYPCTICVTPFRHHPQEPKQIRQLAKPPERGKEYVGDSENKLYHYGWCDRIPEIKAGNRHVFKTADKAAQQGYAPCKACNPPTVVKKTARIIVTPDTKAAQPEPPAPKPGDQQDMGLEVR